MPAEKFQGEHGDWANMLLSRDYPGTVRGARKGLIGIEQPDTSNRPAVIAARLRRLVCKSAWQNQRNSRGASWLMCIRQVIHVWAPWVSSQRVLNPIFWITSKSTFAPSRAKSVSPALTQ